MGVKLTGALAISQLNLETPVDQIQRRIDILNQPNPTFWERIKITLSWASQSISSNNQYLREQPDIDQNLQKIKAKFIKEKLKIKKDFVGTIQMGQNLNKQRDNGGESRAEDPYERLDIPEPEEASDQFDNLMNDMKSLDQFDSFINNMESSLTQINVPQDSKCEPIVTNITEKSRSETSSILSELENYDLDRTQINKNISIGS